MSVPLHACATPTCRYATDQPDLLHDGRCRWCQPVVFVVERSWEGAVVAPGDRIVFSRDGFVNLGIPPVE